MTLERRDLWWAIGMAIVCSVLLDKRGWSEPATTVVSGLVGACLRLLISRFTRGVGTR
jgi:hypothetical protein